MNPRRVLGFILLAAGIALFILGINATGSVGEKLSENVRGRYTDTTTLYIVGGIAAAVGGGALALFGRGGGTRNA